MKKTLPLGKLPANLLSNLINILPTNDSSLLVGPGIGLDCAILEIGDHLLALKTEPITFATEDIGWYSVQIAANDIATTGAVPRWLLVTVLLPEGKTDYPLTEKIGSEIAFACRRMGITVIGGHTEITHGLDRPIINSTLIGEVPRDRLVTPAGAQVGDHLLLTKGVPIESTAILAREFPTRLRSVLTAHEIEETRNYLYEPGISVLRDAQIALDTCKVTAMHDPTEGGVASALWELAQASGRSLIVDVDAIPIPALSHRICDFFGINPLAAIASGALLLTVSPSDAPKMLAAYQQADILCADIGYVDAGPAEVLCVGPSGLSKMIQPERDEIARLFEEQGLD